ncbi:MAG: YifB family Mg chelatase-like AAA ATPase [Paludibacteraceae bacterium]|nr:YifB family Mg chelatase-like AAA ATPase [Paludibacteraceae bacterium]
MPLVKTYGAAVQGVNALPINIEVSATDGDYYCLVGLPDNAVKESRERVNTALFNCGHPVLRKNIVINMAPADIKKEGSAYDLPIAVGIVAATEAMELRGLEKYLIMGELSLDGTLMPIKGALPIAILAREMGLEGFILPKHNAMEAAVVNNLTVYGADNISQVLEFLAGDKSAIVPTEIDTRALFAVNQMRAYDIDFADVKGQDNVKRALEVAAAGGHNIIMIGPPGAGKSMMAKRLPTILPPLTLAEALETTKIHSVVGVVGSETSLIAHRPFRSPHHTISDVALVGGGAYPQPGEISLAHNGVLFLDELPEYKRTVLEVMRQPLEDRKINISRAKVSVEYPASFMLVAAMNPCPCGYYNHPTHPCTCSPTAVQKYLSRISGPLMDRIDIQVEIVPVPFEKLSAMAPAESSAAIRERVVKARQVQQQRFSNHKGIHCNAQMTERLIHKYAEPDEAGLNQLKRAMERYDLSARAYTRILKVARTIADLEGSDGVLAHHIAEAINYRNLDRANWAG